MIVIKHIAPVCLAAVAVLSTGAAAHADSDANHELTTVTDGPSEATSLRSVLFYSLGDDVASLRSMRQVGDYGTQLALGAGPDDALATPGADGPESDFR